MAEPTIDRCIAVWNSPANTGARRATAPPAGPVGTFFSPGQGETRLSGGRPYEVRVAIAIRRSGLLTRRPQPPGCYVYFRYAGDDTTPPAMLTVRTNDDMSAYDLSRATLYHGEDDTGVSGLPLLAQAPDGMLSLTPDPAG